MEFELRTDSFITRPPPYQLLLLIISTNNQGERGIDECGASAMPLSLGLLPGKRYQCSGDGCRLAFRSMKELLDHMRVHYRPTQSLEGKPLHAYLGEEAVVVISRGYALKMVLLPCKL